LRVDGGPSVVVRNLVSEWSSSNEVTLVGYSIGNQTLQNIQHRLIRPSSNLIERAYFWTIDSGQIDKFDAILDASGVIPILLFSKIEKRNPTFLLVQSNQYLNSVIAGQSYLAQIRVNVFQRLSMDLTNHIIVISDHAAKNLQHFFGNAGKMNVIENGVSTKKFRPLGLEKANFVLYVANLKAHFLLKGGPLILNVFSKLSKEYQDLTLIIVGKSDERLQNLSDNLGISSKIRHLGVLRQDELVEWYNRARFLILPSLFDIDPLAVREAMACGTAVIVSDQVGSAKTIINENAGLVFKSGDAEELYNCMKLLLDEPNLTSAMGNNGYKYAVRNLDWSVVAQKYLEVFRRYSK